MSIKTLIDALPLRHKLIAIIFTASATVSLVATGAYLAYDLFKLRASIADNAMLIARTVANYSAADLAFQDRIAAGETLTGLTSIPHIDNAFLFDTNGQLFASLHATPSAPQAFTAEDRAFVRYGSDYLHVSEPVQFEDKVYGSLYLLISLTPLQQGIRDGLLTLAGLLPFAFALSLLLALRLQRHVSQPIVELASAAQRISRDSDYSVRVNPTTRDEIGDLGVAFNTMMERIKERESALEGANRALRAVGACSASMVLAESKTRLFKDLCQAIVEKAGYRMAWIGLAEHDEQRSVVPVASYGVENKYLQQTNITWADEPRGHGPTGEAIRTGKPVVARHILTEPKYAPWREAALQRGYESSLALPLKQNGTTYGALNIYAAKPDAFDAQEMELLSGLARDMIFGIDALRTRAERDQALTVLTQRTAQFEAMFNSIPDAIIFADTQRRIVLNNPAVHTMFGYRDAELLGHTTEMLYANPQDFIDQGRKRFRTGPKTARGAYEIQYKRKDGSVFWTESLGAQVIDSQGNHLGFIGIFRDITERHKAEETIHKLNAELEQRVLDRTSQLEAANKELETFSYSVSHDLRAPLRSIDGFAHALEDDYAEQLDDTAHDYLSRVRKATQRMGVLIDDMLNLSRVARAPLRRQTLDVTRLAQEIIDELKQAEPDRNVDISIAPDLKVSADPVLFRAALQNLLDNAWKYTRRTNQARIEFKSCEHQDTDCFCVRDNGTGFDMQYANKLFAPFQRLHAVQDFEGTGIGLATVARIIRRHGGRIWADSAIDQGATFYFTLG